MLLLLMRKVILLIKTEKTISAASFSTITYFKNDENQINPITSDILYYHLGTTENAPEYFYDIRSSYIDGIEIKNMDIPENLWESSVYSNGVSAFPSEKDNDEKTAVFTKTNFFLIRGEIRYWRVQRFII